MVISDGWTRVEDPLVRLTIEREGEDLIGHWRKDLPTGHLNVLVARSRECGWHVSVSHRLDLADADGKAAEGRIPTWEEIKAVRYQFVPDDVTMVICFPPLAEYVDLYRTAIHLFELIEGERAGKP